MSDVPRGERTLKAVEPGDPVRPRRGPGVAVIAVLGYGLLFLIALFVFSRQSRVQSPKSPASRVGKPAASRASLLEGTGLSPAARRAYFGRVSVDRCDCGCDLTVLTCLARDRSCVRSPQLANERLRTAAARAAAP